MERYNLLGEKPINRSKFINRDDRNSVKRAIINTLHMLIKA